MRAYISRQSEVQRLSWKIRQEGFPRLQMSVLAFLTGLTGFLSSFVLLHLGMRDMSSRYLLATLIAYMAFLFLLWLWLRTKAEEYVDVPDVLSNMPVSSGGSASEIPAVSGYGGEFGGGGASSSFDTTYEVSALAPPVSSGSSGVDVPLGDAIDAAAGADEFALPLLAIMAVAALVLSSLYVIYLAPTLFAELLLDSMLSAGLYRRLSRLPRQHWLETAVGRTIWPFLLTALTAWLAGVAMEVYVPSANSLGEVLYYHATH